MARLPRALPPTDPRTFRKIGRDRVFEDVRDDRHAGRGGSATLDRGLRARAGRDGPGGSRRAPRGARRVSRQLVSGALRAPLRPQAAPPGAPRRARVLVHVPRRGPDRRHDQPPERSRRGRSRAGRGGPLPPHGLHRGRLPRAPHPTGEGTRGVGPAPGRAADRGAGCARPARRARAARHRGGAPRDHPSRHLSPQPDRRLRRGGPRDGLRRRQGDGAHVQDGDRRAEGEVQLHVARAAALPGHRPAGRPLLARGGLLRAPLRGDALRRRRAQGDGPADSRRAAPRHRRLSAGHPARGRIAPPPAPGQVSRASPSDRGRGGGRARAAHPRDRAARGSARRRGVLRLALRGRSAGAGREHHRAPLGDPGRPERAERLGRRRSSAATESEGRVGRRSGAAPRDLGAGGRAGVGATVVGAVHHAGDGRFGPGHARAGPRRRCIGPCCDREPCDRQHCDREPCDREPCDRRPAPRTGDNSTADGNTTGSTGTEAEGAPAADRAARRAARRRARRRRRPESRARAGSPLFVGYGAR